jgi:hypothetical protein
MLSLKAHAIISGSLFATMIVGAIAGNIAHDSGLLRDGTSVQFVIMVTYFTLFVVFGYSLIPLIVKLVLRGQGAIGNSNVGVVRTAVAHESKIVIAFWVLITLGLAVALPEAIKDGFFSPDAAAVIAATPSRGTVVARPGITVDEMKRLSSLPIKGSADSVFAEGNLFDFKIEGTGIGFQRCRYYFMTTSSKDRTRIANISVGTAQSKMTRAQLAAADAALRERLAADGWLTGYENERTEQQRQFHGGRPGGRSGLVWLHGDTVLRVMSRRLDDAKAGEDAATAGEWIQFVELSLRQDYSGLSRYEFAKPEP